MDAMPSQCHVPDIEVITSARSTMSVYCVNVETNIQFARSLTYWTTYLVYHQLLGYYFHWMYCFIFMYKLTYLLSWQ